MLKLIFSYIFSAILGYAMFYLNPWMPKTLNIIATICIIIGILLLLNIKNMTHLYTDVVAAVFYITGLIVITLPFIFAKDIPENNIIIIASALIAILVVPPRLKDWASES
mgnify:CR=1 FL=1|tara:strand:- start:141733 stop:142062 length:330 start_codon:yes stop_codon:yes gene_type:complete